MTGADTEAGLARHVAIEAALEAGALLRQRLRGTKIIDFKGSVDLVTDVDRASEKLIAARLHAHFPADRFVGEEGSAAGSGPIAAVKEATWLVDPLDGTTNYAHGYPHFAVSIAREVGGRIALGVVYDPMRDELFVAERGHGVTLNGAPIEVSAIDSLLRSLLATGFAYDDAARGENGRLWDSFMPLVQGVRRDGAAALNLCWVAAGRLDGFWERPLRPWDVAAGSLCVEEAGGLVTGYRGELFDAYASEVIAANPQVYPLMMDVISASGVQ